MDTGSTWLYMIYVYVVHLNSFPVIEFVQYDIFALHPSISYHSHKRLYVL